VSTFLIVLVGMAVGTTFGAFGAGGSAFATPALALLGLPASIAVASPLPAMLPAAFAGARQYHRAGLLDRRVATRATLVGVPAVTAGAAMSRVVGGEALLVLSGVLLLGAGARMAWPTASKTMRHADGVDDARTTRMLVLVAAAAFLTGLLANGGGFLLVPIFVLVVGLSTARAAGTSMVAVAALVVPTLLVHWWLGDIDWTVAGAFALGVVPASIVGARLGPRMPDAVARRVFGVVLVGFSLWFLVTRL